MLRVCGYILTLLLCCINVGQLLAMEPVVLSNDSPKRVDLTAFSLELVDKTNTLTIDDILNDSSSLNFKPVKGNMINVGYSSSAVWVKFDIANAGNSKQTPILEILGPNINELQVYRYDPISKKLFPFSARGMDYVFKHSEFRNGSYIYNLELPVGGRYTYIIKAHNDVASLRLPILLWKPDAYALHTRGTDLRNGFIFGIMGLILVFALASTIAIREPVYAYYMLYVFTLLCFLLQGRGFLFEWFWPHHPGLNESSIVLITVLTMVCMIKFVQHFLNLPLKSHRFNIIINIVVVYMLFNALTYFFNFGGPNLQVIQITIFNITTFLITLALFIYALWGSFKGDRDSLITIFAFTPLFVLSWAINLRNNTLFPHMAVFEYRIPISFTFEVLVFTIALAYRFKLISDEKEQLLGDLHDLQTQRFRTVIQAVENERKRIALDLHDGLGQMLSTVKLNLSSIDDGITETDKPSYETSLGLLDEACDEVRNMSHNMMPSTLIRKGLVSAIQELATKITRSGSISVTVDTGNVDGKLREYVQIHLYRIVQEVLNNVIKYSEASQVNIKLLLNQNRFFVSIKDNGKGFDTGLLRHSRGIGWSNIYSRASLLGGTVKVLSKEGEGTTVQIEVPT